MHEGLNVRGKNFGLLSMANMQNKAKVTKNPLLVLYFFSFLFYILFFTLKSNFKINLILHRSVTHECNVLFAWNFLFAFPIQIKVVEEKIEAIQSAKWFRYLMSLSLCEFYSYSWHWQRFFCYQALQIDLWLKKLSLYRTTHSNRQKFPMRKLRWNQNRLPCYMCSL